MWELDLGKLKRPKQPYFTQEQIQRILEASPAKYRVLFALLAATGMRIGEAAGLHVDDVDLDNGVISVKRSIWNRQELEPKTDNAVREIDIDPNVGGTTAQAHRVGAAQARLRSSKWITTLGRQHPKARAPATPGETRSREGRSARVPAFAGDDASGKTGRQPISRNCGSAIPV